ncbi:ABC transporter substrate-binding protein [Mucilaginibacter limnophilus]|uniref:ABC transporter substrate-binding protein n=1 Tax=Mucilaginibacter limnophilus TaxID=1932778 RepID=UPI0021D05565|nr:ABC transporter substrate-binding protein [Mucilaginibacter limnophilus]
MGGIFSLTENWTTLGENSVYAMQVAQDDINTYLAFKNAPFRIQSAVANTQLNPNEAKKSFDAAVKGGIKFLIGPQSSAELSAVMPLVGSKALLISQSSTAGSLAIEGDGVFRFCPPDHIEGNAIANTIYNNGIKALVTVARNDDGNTGLQTATGTAFTALGGHIDAMTPYGTSVTNFTSIVATLKSKVEAAKTTYGDDKVGVYLASFDEAVALFKAAANEPVLKTVKWFGGDGIVLSAALLADTQAADFAIATSFYAPTFGLPQSLNTKWAPVAARIKRLSNVDPDAFALAVYDIMWTIAYTLEATNGDVSNMETLRTKFVEQAHAHEGITGDITLDDAGDRQSGIFDYWAIKKDGNTYKWYVSGTSSSTN